jgi:hypothetical protein
MPYPSLIQWIRWGSLEPRIQGIRGSNKAPHLFTYKQALGIARAAAFREVFGSIPSRLVKVLVDSEQATADAEYEAFWRSRRQGTSAFEHPRIEETFSTMIRDLPGGGLMPEEEAWAEETLRRQQRVIIAFGLFGWGQPDQSQQVKSVNQ